MVMHDLGGVRGKGEGVEEVPHEVIIKQSFIPYCHHHRHVKGCMFISESV